MSNTSRYLNLPTLTIQEGYGAGREIVLDRDGMIVGRDSDCDIVLDDRNVSRHHLRITGTPGNMAVEDLNSANGTFVNSSPIRKKQIKHLDVIQVGSVMMVFDDPDNSGFGSQSVVLEEVKNENSGYTFEFLRQTVTNLEKNIATVFKGKPEVIRDVIVCLFADGHLLIEDVPGVGKSILAQALAKSVQAQYRRIQFTPDMLPSDITGMNVYDEKNQTFKFLPGPIFGNVILADEINRTTPRTQSSLLECMSESVVTIDGKGPCAAETLFRDRHSELGRLSRNLSAAGTAARPLHDADPDRIPETRGRTRYPHVADIFPSAQFHLLCDQGNGCGSLPGACADSPGVGTGEGLHHPDCE